MTTKEKILDSALNLFVKNGVDKTSTNSIAIGAGVASGTVFVHFKTKQELVDQVYLLVKNDLKDALVGWFSENKSVRDNFKEIFRRIINHYLQKPVEYKFITIIKPGLDISKDVITQSESFLKPIQEYTKLVISRGEIKNLPLTLIQSLTWNMVIQTIEFCLQKKDSKVNEIYLEPIWDMIKI